LYILGSHSGSQAVRASGKISVSPLQDIQHGAKPADQRSEHRLALLRGPQRWRLRGRDQRCGHSPDPGVRPRATPEPAQGAQGAQGAPVRLKPEPINDLDQIIDLGVRRRDWLGGTLHEYEHEARPERTDFSLPTALSVPTALSRSRVG
jgi:hypothetical protein